jgi:tRNA dimethylallyltransferase
VPIEAGNGSTGVPIPAIVGPTASGKSDLGIALARALGGEVINLDSVQVYRRIYVATAKVPPEEQQGVPHHLIDVAEPTENFTAGDWAREAARLVPEIEARRRIALLVGGSGFYLKALREGLFDAPSTDPAIRDRLKARLARRGPTRLHGLLERFDPESAARLPVNDASRVIRALEVRLATGIPLSRLHAERPPRPPCADIARRIRIIALAPPRDVLYDRINRRTDLMFAAGFVDEVRTLLEAGVPPDAKALGAHGYRRVVEFLLGRRSLESAVEQTKLDTRHYAKRQVTWWRGTEGVHWIHEFGHSDTALREAQLYLDKYFQ